jgi:hypothetical protein
MKCDPRGEPGVGAQPESGVLEQLWKGASRRIGFFTFNP